MRPTNHTACLTRILLSLTQSESTQPEYKEFEDRINEHGVRFRGVLTLDTLDWVQPAARKRINKDIRLRHVALHLAKSGDTGTRNLNSPTLEKIYQVSSPNRKIKIIVQCNKLLPALYLKYGKALAHRLRHCVLKHVPQSVYPMGLP